MRRTEKMPDDEDFDLEHLFVSAMRHLQASGYSPMECSELVMRTFRVERNLHETMFKLLQLPQKRRG